MSKRRRIGVTGIVVIAGLALLIRLILAVYPEAESWTGFGQVEYDKPAEKEITPAKTLWDWMDLLLVPSILALGGFWFNRQERTAERDIAHERRREDALQNYLDQMTVLLIDKKLRTSEREEKRDIARTRTLAVLRQLDRMRKGMLVQFLTESDLIKTESPIVGLGGADLSGVSLSGVSLSGANLSRAILRGSDLSQATLTGANLFHADLREADLRGAKLYRANLSGADLSGADLGGADLIAVIVDPGTRLDWKWRLTWQIVNGKADLGLLAKANLSGANLNGADLVGAKLSGANLTHAELRKTKLSGADLRSADLSGADLREAYLFRVDLRGAKLRGAKLRGAEFSDDTRWPGRFNPAAAGAEKI